MKKRILGLDTGTNSLGWAVVDKLENGQYELIKRGSLIFQEGVKIEKGKESSKASERTGHRALRKQYFRRRLRKIEVLKVLVKYGLCPPLTDEQLHLWHVKKIYPITEAFILWQRTSDIEDKNPYHDRFVCLTQALDMQLQDHRYVLGRAMYHLAQRRGFMSNRLDVNDEKESGAVKSGISQLSSEMQAAGCQCLGEYFYKLYRDSKTPVRIRQRYIDREEHYLKEFNTICQKQNLPAEMVDELKRALYFQRPLKSQKQGVGRCTFEPLRPRCAASHPAYEEFRMWQSINNIKVQGPYDDALRPLSEVEIQTILPLFYRKSKTTFDFEEVAKAVAGKDNYQYVKDEGQKAYRFNYRMSQSLSGNPTCAALMAVFGSDYVTAIAESYTQLKRRDGSMKSADEAVDDVWNALYSLETKEKVKTFAVQRLQLAEDEAEKFSKIRLSRGYASISLCAVRKILPYLKQGIKYSHAVFMANIPTIVGASVWQSGREYIERTIIQLMRDIEMDTRGTGEYRRVGTPLSIEDAIIDFLQNNFDLKPGVINRLYHPSMIDVYPDAKPNKNGVYQLGSPANNAIRNPMAMRSLHQVRHVVNELLRQRVIDSDTEVHIEYARELNDANKRKALAKWNLDRQRLREKYRAEIVRLYKENKGLDIEPTDTDIDKYEMWEEQEHKCLYTGQNIGITDFIGKNSRFDVEHTIPRSVGGDSSMMNLTLCDNHFNRYVKCAQMPSQLANFDEILTHIEKWEKRVADLRREIDRIHTHSGMDKGVKDELIQKRHYKQIEYDYWKGKVERFHMTEVPSNFSLRQGAGIGLVSKYAGLYLRSLFHRPDDRTRSNVRVVKGLTTAEFRRMWGLQDEYEKKCRDNHVHHCVDAIVIACMDADAYSCMAQYYHDEEQCRLGRKADRPQFPKPWPTFTQDVKRLYDEVFVAHDTPDNMPKKALRRDLATPTGHYLAQGDSARGALHQDTYYGAISRDGEIRYVARKLLSSFEKPSDIEKIVDDAVRDRIKSVVAEKGFKYLKAGKVYMNEKRGIEIRKVRCYADAVKNPLDIRLHRDVSTKEYKQQYHVANDGNYAMGIYIGEIKGKEKRDFELCTTMDAATYYRRSSDRESFDSLLPKSRNGLPLCKVLKIGTRVLLYEKHPDEVDLNNPSAIEQCLYKVTGLSRLRVSKYEYGSITLKHCKEARPAGDLKAKNGAYKKGEEYRPVIAMYHTQLNALVEGIDFEINCLGEIEML